MKKSNAVAVLQSHLNALRWHTPPAEQGQMIENEYATDGEDMYKHVYDRSVQDHRYYITTICKNFDPINEVPKPKHGWVAVMVGK